MTYRSFRGLSCVFACGLALSACVVVSDDADTANDGATSAADGQDDGATGPAGPADGTDSGMDETAGPGNGSRA